MSGRHFFEHDERGPSVSKPQKSYRGQKFVMGRSKDQKYRNSGFPGGKSRLVDLDGDVDMGGNFSNVEWRRYNPYNHNVHKACGKRKCKKNCKHKRGSHGNADRGDTHTWQKVSIPHGKKLGKRFILESIMSYCKVSFTAYNFQHNKNSAEFYVNGMGVASIIKDASRQIKTPDGFKMVIFVSSCNAPVPVIDSSVIEIMKTCMSSCYDPQTQLLNLMKFHHLDALKQNGLYVCLNRPSVFAQVIKIIKENIPEIKTLILSDNKLYSLDVVSSLVSTCKNLRIVNLQNNRLRNISELNHMKGLELDELTIDGNPLCDDFKDKTSYISEEIQTHDYDMSGKLFEQSSAVRDRFPKLRRLDGHDLPAPIGFDLGTETLPVSKKSFFAADEVKDLVIQFLDLYYTIYDSGDRSRLLDAYHDQAAFSLCLSKNSQKTGQGSSLGAYSFDNRNLLREMDANERFKLLKQGKLGVVNALQELPQTMHDPSSFSVDIFHVSPGLMSFSVLGVFKEVGADINTPTLKTFSRTFVVVPQGTGFVIVNETLFIAHASREQQEKAFKVPAPTPSPSPAPPIEEKTPNEKTMLVMELCKQTGMNIDFSTKCLEENDWDFQRSLVVFMKFQSEGKLPPEAFIKLES